MNYSNLMNYYNTNFILKHHHNWSIDELENLIVFERDIYSELLVQELKRKENS